MRKVLALALSLSVVLTTQLLIWRQQGDVTVTQMTVSGNAVDYFESHGPAAGTVIVAHGFSANKVMMRQWGYALARRGFHTYVYDQPGHGESSQPLPPWREAGVENPLGRNLTAIVDDLVRQGKAQPGRIALVGHSMGATTVLAAAANDDRVAATVAISTPTVATLPSGKPNHLLSLVAEGDPVGIQRAVTAMARPAETVPGKNHITVMYAGSVMEQTAAWIHKSLGTTAPDVAPKSAPWWLVILALAAAVAVTLSGAAILAPAAGRAGGGTSLRTGPGVGLVLLAIAALTAVLGGVYIRIPAIGLAVVDYVLPYFLVMAAVLFVLRMLWPRDFAYPLTQGPDMLPVAVLRGAAVFLGCFGALGTVLHMNLSNSIPPGARVVPILLIAIGLWPFLVQEEALKRAVVGGSNSWLAGAVGVVAKLIIAGTWLAAAALPNPPAFLSLIMPIVMIVLLGLEAVGLLLRRWSYSPAAIGTFSALVLGWFLGVTFPLV